MRRPNYSALTGVTTALVAVAAFRVAFQPEIPPPHPEIALWGKGEFVTRAAVQDINWYPLNPATFAEAQRLSRPIFIAVGVPWSALGREADRAFASADVATALNQGFIPIRVDAAQDPRWLSEFLPLQRAQTGFSIGFQGWVFDLRGRLIDFIGRVDSNEALDQQKVLNALVRAQERFADTALTDDVPPLEATQNADTRRLLDPDISDLSLANAARTLSSSLDMEWGGWNIHGFIASRPLTLRFLQLAGEGQQAGLALHQSLFTPRADWIDGGLFRVVNRETKGLEYDKVCQTNAQYAEALAVQDALHPDSLLRAAAKRTTDWLVSLQVDRLVPGAEEGDEDARGRSERSSFPPKRLRQAVREGKMTPEEKSWAEDNLGLDGSGGLARVAYPTRAYGVADTAKLEKVFSALRRTAGTPRNAAAPGLADVNGAVAASLLRIARLWKDQNLAVIGGDMVDRLDHFRTGGTVRHSLFGATDPFPYLGDSLAYADAALEDFLTNGRVPSLERGAFVLREALRTFRDGGNGVLRPTPASVTLIPRRFSLPQVTDDEREALNATALRLLNAYATTLGPDGADFRQAAVPIYSRLSAVAEAVPSMGGALGALSRHLDNRAAFVVGEDAAVRAVNLAHLLPNRLVVPVLGPARRDLQSRPSGIYLVTPSGPTGPWSASQIQERLPAGLEVGL
jgi:uncharacterized protein YyaL (SSP411 family)